MSTNDQPPNLLWHYTNWEAAKSIVLNRELWASDARCMNDSAELKVAWDLIVASIPDDLHQFLPATGPDFGKQGEPANLRASYVISFSSVPDDLSQWRAYANSHVGVALGFDAEYLEEYAKKDFNSYFERFDVIYDEAKQKAALSQELEYLAAAVASYRRDIAAAEKETRPSHREEQAKKVNEDFRTYLWRVAHYNLPRVLPKLKHQSFRDEREVRFIAGDTISTMETVMYPRGYRLSSTGSMIVPYAALTFDPRHIRPEQIRPPRVDPPPCPLRAAIIGPGPHKEWNTRAFRAFVNSSPCLGMEVFESKIPYRNW